MAPPSAREPTAPQNGASSAYHYFSSRAIIEDTNIFDELRGNTRFYTNLDPNAPLIDIGSPSHQKHQPTAAEPEKKSKDSGKDTKMDSKMNIKKESPEKKAKKEDDPEINPSLPTSFLRTYTAARGPVDGKEGYPLAAWMHLGNAPTRPAKTNDLRAIPKDERANIPAHPGWENDPDDVEGDAPSVRIKPEDFLAFSKGAARWNRDDAKDPGGILIGQPRLRPASSEQKPPRGDKYPEYITQAQSQGDQITPTYPVPSSPSIVYTPPGIPSNSHRTDSFVLLYSRMNPTPRGLPNPPDDSSYERYTEADVKRVLANVAVHGQTPTEAVGYQKGYIDQKLAEIEAMNATEKENNAITAANKVRLEQLRYQYKTLKDTYIPLLQYREQAAAQARKEAEEKAKKAKEMEQQKKEYHDGRVREHLIGRVDDVHIQHHTAAMRANQSIALRTEVEAEISYLEQGITEECIIAGKSSFDDVYKALNDPKLVPDAPHAPFEDDGKSGSSVDVQMGGMSLDTPDSSTVSGTVSVFEPGSKTSKKVEYTPGVYDRAGGGTPVPVNESPSKSPKGKYVPREGRQFNLALTGSVERSESMECLSGGVVKGKDDSRDVREAGPQLQQDVKKDVPQKDAQKDVQQETQQETQQTVPGFSTRYANEEVGESSKQGEEKSKPS